MKRHQSFKRLCSVALAFTLSTGVIVPVVASGAENAAVQQQEKIAAETPIGTVYITDNSYMTLTRASVLPGEEGQHAAFTITLHNRDNYDIQFIDYWIRLKSKDGTRYSVQLMPQDKEKNRVPANSSTDIGFYAKVGSDISLNDLVFSIIRWDFSVANFERAIGEITVPADYSPITRLDEKRVLAVSGTELKTGISKVLINQNSENYFVSLYYDLSNIGSRSVKLPEYSFFVRTPQGFMYPLDAAAAKELTLHPLVAQEVRLTGTIPSSVKEEGWQLVLTETEATTQVQRAVAYYELPKGDSEEDVSTGVNEKKTIQVDNVPLDASIRRVTMNKNDVNYMTTVYFTLENKGNEVVKVPNYRFVLRTGEGLNYPVTAEGLEQLTISPRASKELQLAVSIPVSVSTDNLELIVNQPAAQGSEGSPSPGGFEYPVATFKLPAPSRNEGVVGSVNEFTNSSGVYAVKFEGVQRLPWEDQDIIAAELVLSNKGTSSLPLPSLNGYFLLDGAIRVPAKLIQTDNVISVRGDSGVGFKLYGTIPYTYDYSEVKLVLQEKVGESELNDLVEFRHDQNEPGIPLIEYGQKYTLDGVGRKSALGIRSVRTYEGIDADMYTVQLNVDNLEKRFTNVSKLVAFFKTKDELIFAANLSEVTQKISPLGQATLNVSAMLPKNYDTSGMQLIIGEGVIESRLAVGADKPDGFVNGVAFDVPTDDRTPKQDFLNLELFPYTVSINRLSARVVETTKFTLSFDYTLSKNTFVETAGTDEHKLIVEFEDPAGNYKFTETFTLDKGSDNEVAGNLVVGQHNKTIIKLDEVLLHKLPYLQTYKINVYDEFLGQKRLLGSQTFNWHVTSE